MDREGNKIIQLYDGTTVGLRAGMWAFKQIQQKYNCKGILDMMATIAPENNNIDTNIIITTIMEVANDYVYNARKGEIIDERGAATLIDKMGGIVEAARVINSLLEHLLPKNLTPLQTEGEPILQ